MVEHVIESIRVACSNVNHICTARISYYQKEDHEKGCQHAPYLCPEAGSSFSRPTTKLHMGQSFKVTYKKVLEIFLRVGSTIIVCEDGHLFLANMVPEPLGGVISVCCTQPHIT
jgi:E3 ubiquitin-protein ligase SIAH1